MAYPKLMWFPPLPYTLVYWCSSNEEGRVSEETKSHIVLEQNAAKERRKRRNGVVEMIIVQRFALNSTSSANVPQFFLVACVELFS